LKLLSAVAKLLFVKHTQISKIIMTQKSWVQFQENKNESQSYYFESKFIE